MSEFLLCLQAHKECWPIKIHHQRLYGAKFSLNIYLENNIMTIPIIYIVIEVLEGSRDEFIVKSMVSTRNLWGGASVNHISIKNTLVAHSYYEYNIFCRLCNNFYGSVCGFVRYFTSNSLAYHTKYNYMMQVSRTEFFLGWVVSELKRNNYFQLS